jgi:hypothetical protein
MHSTNYGHSFAISASTPFGSEDFLLLIDDISNEAEISNQRGNAKFKSYSIEQDSFCAKFDVDTPMTTSIEIAFQKLEGTDIYTGKVKIGEFMTAPIKVKRHL